MKKYKVTFKSDETDKIITINVEALGICPAIEEAIRKMICKPTFGAFYYPIKAEEVEIANSVNRPSIVFLMERRIYE